MAQTTTRLSAAERKDTILDAALIEFADRGFEGTSTEDIAKRAGISQPYLFRLFGTKKELYIASVSRCYRDTLEQFQRAGSKQPHIVSKADCAGRGDVSRGLLQRQWKPPQRAGQCGRRSLGLRSALPRTGQ